MFSGCSQSAFDSPQKLYGEDANYYIALRELNNGREKEAMQLLSYCAEKGSYYIARRSAEMLTTLGTLRDKLAASKKLVEKYADDEALLVACQQYELAEEYTKIIMLTETLNMAECDSKLARMRLMALFQRNSSQFDDSAYEWYTSRNITSAMYKLYQDTMTEYGGIEPDKRKIINFRINVYRANYRAAYEHLEEIYAITAPDGTLALTAQIVSDMGKACLYGSENYTRNARLFDEIASREVSDANITYNAWFYAGRLYDRTDSRYATAATRFINALDNAQSNEQHDNALWYLLSASLRTSADNTISILEQYCTTIHNPAYFDDFFELFVPLLLSQARWSVFKNLYETIDGYASDEAVARFAYIYARLVQEGLVQAENPESEIEKAFMRALKSGSSVYYKALACTRLNLSEEETARIIRETDAVQRILPDSDIERLLVGYALFGLPEKIYPEWLALTSEARVPVRLECAVQIADFLNKTATNTDDYYTQSLRIISRAVNSGAVELTEDAIALLYPRNYSSEVETICKKFSLNQEVLYALIRSESFFDHDIVSTAGAVGLTQLMEFTAADIAQRLKRQEFLLHDPETNIEFGAYYLASLIKRFDNSVLTAFFAYNAGPTRARRWLQNFRIEMGRDAMGAYDLFLETIPYSETREYGRKLVSASVLYGNIYFNKSVQTVVKEIINQ